MRTALRSAGVVGCVCATLLVGSPLASGAAVAAKAGEADSSQLVRLSPPGGELQAVVSPVRGAELVGLEVRRDGQWSELLYRGMDFKPTQGWSGRAPILWPAVGRNFLDPPGPQASPDRLGWMWHGKAYPIGIHGFARDLSWRVVDRGSCEGSEFVRLVLHDSPQTRRSYPFGFELTSEYRVWRDSLYLRQWVRAARGNSEPMPFSIGNHLTLRIPLLPGSAPGATTLSTPGTQQVITDRSGRPTGQIASVDYMQPRRLDSLEPLTPISLSGYAEKQAWVRIADPSGFAVTVEHSEERRPMGVPVLFNLWGDPGQNYFAPEPWVGKQNSLASGDGVIALAPGDSYQWTIAVRIAGDGVEAAAASERGIAPTCR